MSSEIKVYPHDFEFSNGYPVTNFVYLHGTLQKIHCGYDLCYVDNLPNEDGVYDCKVIKTENETIDAKLFIWYCEWKGVFHGLIVDINDHEFMQDAERKFAERKEFL